MSLLPDKRLSRRSNSAMNYYEQSKQDVQIKVAKVSHAKLFENYRSLPKYNHV